MPSPTTKPAYGIDAPTVVRNFFVIGAVCLIAASLLEIHVVPFGSLCRFAPSLLGTGASCLVSGSFMVWGSKVGKLRLRNRLIARFPWQGDEQVLDVGCGHGLMLIAAAKRLTSGSATGIDIWQSADQAGNSQAATQANVDLEGVADRVRLMTADARSMPFADASFEIVLSSWTLHNIYSKHERTKAIREIIRVLKPGGRAVISDIRHAREYARVFREAGFTDVHLSLPNFVFLIPTLTLTTVKPAA